MEQILLGSFFAVSFNPVDAMWRDQEGYFSDWAMTLVAKNLQLDDYKFN